MRVDKKIGINMKKCRCCESLILNNPLLHYDNMPGKAQNFPDIMQIKEDKGITLDIYECPYCGLVQIFEEPVSYYRDVIRAIAVSEEMREFRKQYFHKFLENCNLFGKKVIEVGAGCGEYMEILEKEDVEVYGLEHLVQSVQMACHRGLHVYQGFIESSQTEIPGAPYDGFYTMNFLEHIPKPKEFLKSISSNLTKDGYGLVEVPNGDFIFKKYMFSEFMLDHLSYFSKDSLCRMLELSGFEVVSCKVIWHEYILSAIVKKRKPISVQKFKTEQTRLVEEAKAYVREMQRKGKKIALWGAGHQALAFLSLAKLQTDLECVIDSAEFKQNKFTPATHLPIVAPSKIEELKIGAIIVMAGSYSDEVQRMIQKNYKQIDTKVL